MRKLLLVFTAFLCAITGFAQVQPTAPAQGNLNGNLFANGYGGWGVPQGNSGTFSWTSNTFCTANYGGTTFRAFTVGTPITIVDQITPTHNEDVTVTSVDTTSNQCSIGTSTPVYQHNQFSLKSATAGLQEALNANLETTVATTVHLTADWYRLGGTISMVTATAQGTTNLGIVDETRTPSNWYAWNGSHYVFVPIGGGSGALALTTNGTSGLATLTPGSPTVLNIPNYQSTLTLTTIGNAGPATINGSILNVPNYAVGGAGQLGTRQSDIPVNNGDNTQPVDSDIYVANSPTSGNAVYTPQQAATAANAHNGSFIIQPGAAGTPFTNPGNARALDLSSVVPATARSVKEDGAVCDTGVVYGTLVLGSTSVALINTARTSADIGRSIIAVGVTPGGTVTQFESVITAVPDSLHLTITTGSPFNQATNHAINLGHDDTAAITKTMATVGGGGTLVIPAGICMTHTQVLRGQSPIGLGPNSFMLQIPGEDLFQAPDPSLTTGVNQGAAHIHDLTFLFDSRIDATQPWQKVNDSGTTAVPALYRPGAALSGVAANPLAPGWMVGARNGVANINSGSAVMCVPNAETPPSVGQTVIFPYQTTIYTSTVASTAGSCSAGFTARTLNANLGITSAQAEWFAGSSAQNLSTSISSGSCPSTITLANSINPVAGFESNVPGFGLIQIDGEQFTYFGKSNAQNPSPANTLYGIQCAQNGTSRAAHSSAATVFPLNRFKPAYPWPVIPSINTNDTTPAATATYYPGWNAGNAVWSFPVVSGATPIGSGAWTANAKIENLSFLSWPNEINGENWQEVNNTTLFYFVTPSYAATFSNWFGLYSSFGIFNGPPSLENHAYATAQPTGDGTHWDGMQIYASNPMILAAGNQNSFANFNVYSNSLTTTGSQLGANTCWYMIANHDDQTGNFFTVLSLDHFKNIYCEPETGPSSEVMPHWEWDTFNSEIEDQHMGGGGEVDIGGSQQHWFGGNFNNSATLPALVWGAQNSSMRSTNLNSEPKGNVYGTNSLINFNFGNDFSGTTSQAFGSPGGPWGAGQIAGRQPIPSQTNETLNTGNLTAPYTSSEGGFISPEEFNAQFSLEAQAMSVGYTYDSTAPVTHSYTACSVGNNPATTYCFTSKFNGQALGVGPGQRITNGKYVMWLSAKDVTAATNTWTLGVGTTCNGSIITNSIPIKNTWPAVIGDYFQVPVDFTGVTAPGCSLQLAMNGATTADQMRISLLGFSPVAEEINAQTINVTTINLPGGSTGGNPAGCAQSPVIGINQGYTCPTKGFETSLTGNQGISDTTAAVTTTTGLSPSGCFFVDSEYECYAGIAGSTLTGLTRGAYTTAAATHNTAASVTSVNLVLGSLQQSPVDVIAGGAASQPVFGINNGFPSLHSGTASLDINTGSNELWVDSIGAIHQSSTSANNQLGTTQFGTNPHQPQVTQSGYLLQTNGPNSAYSPLSLGGGHAGSLNVITTPNVPAATVTDFTSGGSTTVSYVCAGTDFDGNLIPGTTASVSTASSSWAFPRFIQAVCPWTAGVNTYQIYRTAGGIDQGLLASGSGPGFTINDFNGSSSGGTPPVSNTSNPHISVAGTGNPCITMGAVSAQVTICSGTGAPATACGTQPTGSGSLYMRTDGGASTSLYSCGATTWTAVTIP